MERVQSERRLFSGGAGRARVWVYWRSGIFVARTWMLVRRAYAFSVAIFCASALGTESRVCQRRTAGTTSRLKTAPRTPAHLRYIKPGGQWPHGVWPYSQINLKSLFCGATWSKLAEPNASSSRALAARSHTRPASLLMSARVQSPSTTSAFSPVPSLSLQDRRLSHLRSISGEMLRCSPPTVAPATPRRQPLFPRPSTGSDSPSNHSETSDSSPYSASRRSVKRVRSFHGTPSRLSAANLSASILGQQSAFAFGSPELRTRGSPSILGRQGSFHGANSPFARPRPGTAPPASPSDRTANHPSPIKVDPSNGPRQAWGSLSCARRYCAGRRAH